MTVYDLDNNLFQALNMTTRPRVHWSLLYTLTVFYVLAVGPGHYLWARRQRDYRVSLAVLTVGVAGSRWFSATSGGAASTKKARC